MTKSARELMLAETWLTGAECVELGLADAASSEGCAGVRIDFRLSHLPSHRPPSSSQGHKLVGDSNAEAQHQPNRPRRRRSRMQPPIILERAAAAKLSAVETRDIIAKAAGDADKARDLIIEHMAAKDIALGGRCRHHRRTTPAATRPATTPRWSPRSREAARQAGHRPFRRDERASRLAGEWMRARGITPSAHDADTIVREAMGSRRNFLMCGPGFHTTSDLPIILKDSMNNELARLFVAADVGVSQVVGTGTLPDYRDKTLGKLSSFPALAEVPESGEITWGSLVEAGEVMNVADYARAIAVSNKVLVNDSLDAVGRSLRDVAFAAANLKASLIITAMFTTTLSDTYAIFDTHHSNTSNYGAIGVSGLGNMRKAMRAQTALDGTTPLGLGPAIIFVPATLETTAQLLVAEITPASISDVNPFSNMKLAVDPRLDAVSTSLLVCVRRSVDLSGGSVQHAGVLAGPAHRGRRPGSLRSARRGLQVHLVVRRFADRVSRRGQVDRRLTNSRGVLQRERCANLRADGWACPSALFLAGRAGLTPGLLSAATARPGSAHPAGGLR